MSNKLLSEQELKNEAYKILGSPHKNVDPKDADSIVALVNREKLAWADMVLKEKADNKLHEDNN